MSIEGFPMGAHHTNHKEFQTRRRLHKSHQRGFDRGHLLWYSNSIIPKEALIRNTQKAAITIPIKLVGLIDDISKKKRMSRSKFITTVLKKQILNERNQSIKEAYDRIFSDDSISRE